MLDTRPSRTDTLQRIAVLLDCSVETLMEPSGEVSRVAGVSELFELWFEIDDAGARQELLQFAQRLVAGDTEAAALR